MRYRSLHLLRGVAALWVFWFIIAGTCLLCYPFYRLCEAPFMHAKPTLIPADKPAVLPPDPVVAEGSVAVGRESP